MKTEKTLLSQRSLHCTILLVLCFIISPVALVKAQYCTGDSLALVEIYKATNGASWTSSANWLTGPLKTWEGVQLTDNRVTGLSLPSNNLTGKLPYHIGFLQELRTLSLQGNNLTGGLPSALVFLQKLRVLNFSNNKFTGSIPSTLGFNSSLMSLNLSGNKLTGSLPASLALLSKLAFLDLSNNQLGGSIPAALGYLGKLQSLALNNNKLSGGIPTTIGNLNSAKEIYLFNNQLSGSIPSGIGELDSVIFFNASNNKLSGALPASTANLKFIYFLNIESNQIKDLPNLSGVSSLFQLYVANNKLTFADIEPNITKVQGGNYAPQDSVGTNQVVEVCAGATLTLPGNYIESSPNNTYTWFKTDFSFIADPSSSPVLTIPNVTAANGGLYSVEIANSVATDLLLYRRTVRVKVKTCPSSAQALQSGDTKVYPVPFSQSATVEIAGEKEGARIIVTDLNGNVLERHDDVKGGTAQIGENLQKGTYLVQSIHDGKREAVRVIKN
jgi:Leucine-rich repeat (LRR) protein